MGFIMVPGAEHFQVPKSEFLLYYSIFLLTAGVSMAVAGPLVPHIGIRRLIITGGVACAAGFLAMSFAADLTMLNLVAALVGIGWGTCTAMAATVVINGWMRGKGHGTVLGLVMAMSGVGGMIWGLVMPQVIGSAGWSGGFQALSVAMLLLVVFPGVVLISNPPSSGAEPAGQRKSFRPTPGLVLVFVLLATASFTLALETPVISMLPSLFASSGATATQAGALYSFFSLCVLLGKPVLGWLHDKGGFRAAGLASAAAYAAGFSALAFAQGIFLQATVVVLVALAMCTTTIVLPLTVATAVGQQRFASVYGPIMMLSFIGMSVGAPLWALSLDLSGSYTAALFTGGAAGAGAVGLLALALQHAARRGVPVPAATEQLPAADGFPDQNFRTGSAPGSSRQQPLIPPKS
jgi:MFS family permease